MDLDTYVARYRASKSYSDRQKLYKDIFEEDNKFRKLFTQQRESWVVPELSNSFQSLIPVFQHEDLFDCLPKSPEEAAIPTVFPLGKKRKPAGARAIVTRSEFKRNFDDLFTEGSLRYIDWSNVFAAGGSVMACLQPLPPKHDTKNRARRKYMHDIGFPGGDIDLFLYGLNAEQATEKIIEIYDAIQETNPFDVLCFRSAHTITIVSQYPFRHIQIVLRLYSSPFEVLAGFDVDSCAVGYDGNEAWITPRCQMALATQSNPVNLTRRSPTYEMRLAKYAGRGFEVPVPGLQRSRVDPTLFEQPWHKVNGLAKLLLLERLRTPEARHRYREQHRTKQMRMMYHSAFARKFGFRGMVHNPSMAERMEDFQGSADASDYSTVFLPWGRGIDCYRCKKMMQAKDRMLNNSYISRGRTYNLHPCFIGKAEKVVKDCYPNDPPIPDDVDEEELAGYVRGPLTFIEDDPGRQMIGSFHPIEDEDWLGGAYISVEMDSLSFATNANDLATMTEMLGKGISPNTNDFAGRTPLHIAALCGNTEAAKLILDAGGRMISRMADGRTVLHIAAAHGWVELGKLFLEKSKANKEAKEKRQEDKDSKEEVAVDVLDVEVAEWTNKMTPLQLAMLFGQVEMVQLLLDYGADPNHGWPIGDVDDRNFEVVPSFVFPMHLSRWNPEASEKILKMLLNAGCQMLRLDNSSIRNLLHYAAGSGHPVFLSQVLELVPDIKKKGLNVISLRKDTPLHTAVSENHSECVEKLLDAGALLKVGEMECEIARRRSAKVNNKHWSTRYAIQELEKITPNAVPTPLWTAVKGIQSRISNVAESVKVLAEEQEKAAMGGRDEPTTVSKTKDPFAIIKMLIEAGADVNEVKPKSKETMVDFTENVLKGIEKSREEDKVKAEKTAKEFKEKCEWADGRSSGPTTVVDGIEVCESTGLPASYKSTASVRKLLEDDTLPADSYVRPSLEARALEQDAHILMDNIPSPSQSDNKWQEEAYRKLLTILKEAGGKTYEELGLATNDESSDEEEDVMTTKKKKKKKADKEGVAPELKVSDVIGTYTITQTRMSFFGTIQDDVPLPDEQQAAYHQLFEAAWRGDRAYIEKVTIDAPQNDQLLVAAQNSYHQTPLMLALIKGHLDLAHRIIEICALQYTPPPKKKKPKQEENTRGDKERMKLNNYAVQMFVDDEEEVEERMEQMLQEEEKAAAMAEQEALGIDADVGMEAVETKAMVSNTSPEELLGFSSAIPAHSVETAFPEEWKMDHLAILCLVWKIRKDGDVEAYKTLKEKYNVNLGRWYHGGEQQCFRNVTPIMLAILTQNLAMLDMLLDCCELWDKQWKEMAAQRVPEDTDEDDDSEDASEDGEEEEEKDEDEEDEAAHGKEDQTELACKLISEAYSTYHFSGCLFRLSDVPVFEKLVERTGFGSAFELKLKGFKEDLKREEKTRQEKKKKLQAKKDADSSTKLEVEGGEGSEEDMDFECVGETLTTMTFLHMAIRTRSRKIVEWILSGGPVRAFEKFLKRGPVSKAARYAQRLGGFFLKRKYIGVSDQPDAAHALAMYYFGDFSMLDDSKRNVFHYALMSGDTSMVPYLLRQAQAKGLEAQARAIMNKPRTNTSSCRYYGYEAAASCLQTAALSCNKDFVKVFLDEGADYKTVDGNTERGWNILGFAVAGDDQKQSVEVVKLILSHPSISPEAREELVAGQFGKQSVTPLMIATHNGNVEMIKLLQESLPKGSLTKQASNGNSAVHMAARQQNLKTLKTLLPGEQKQTKLETGDVEENVVKEEVKIAAGQEDFVGLTPLDITANNLCSQYQHTARPSNLGARSRGSSNSATKAYLVVRDANPEFKRERPTFEEVQASILKDADNVNKNAGSGDIVIRTRNDTPADAAFDGKNVFRGQGRGG